MDRTEQLVDDVIQAYRSDRLGLWLANFNDLPDDFEQWGGLIRVSAEMHLRNWKPPRSGLLERVRRRAGSDAADRIEFDDVAGELLPIAREDFAKDLAAKHVPARVVERAKEVLRAEPPVQQWKM